MNVKPIIERTYNISDITETQATALLTLCVDHCNDEAAAEYWACTDIPETLDALRQALLNAGVAKTEKVTQ